jgi:hypothetical protein
MDMKKILQALDSTASKPVEGSDTMKKFLSVVTEGSNPHKVALPVQMAMQHYAEPVVAQPKPIKEVKKTAMSSMLYQYYTNAEQRLAEEDSTKKEIISEQARRIADRILNKNKHTVAESFNGEYDDEAGMAEGSLQTLKRAVDGLMNTIEDHDNLPEWCQEKISLAEDYLVTVWDYIQSEKSQGNDPQINEHRDAYQRDYDSSRTGFGRREREDDEYHVPDPVDNRIAYKVIATVTTQDGSEEKKGVTVKTTGGPKHAETVATKHLENAGLQVTGIVSVHDMGPV